TDTSFDGLVTTVQRLSPVMSGHAIYETTTRLADGSGSYSWVRTTTPWPLLPTNGITPAYASHTIDANGVDTWTWNENTGSGTNSTIRIDAATEKRYLEIAARLYDTAFDRDMYESERQFLAKYIVNGSLNTTQLANDLLNSVEFRARYPEMQG